MIWIYTGRRTDNIKQNFFTLRISKDSNLPKVQSFTLETATYMESTVQSGPLENGASFES